MFGNFSLFKTPFLGRNSIPPSFVSFFVFYIFSYLLLKSWVAFLGAWCPLPAFRSCFVEFTRCLNALLMNLWGRKSSPHPNPPPSWLLPPRLPIYQVPYIHHFSYPQDILFGGFVLLHSTILLKGILRHHMVIWLIQDCRKEPVFKSMSLPWYRHKILIIMYLIKIIRKYTGPLQWQLYLNTDS